MKTQLASLAAAAIAAITLSACATTGATGGTTPAKVKPYPSDLCIVTDNKLGSMGDPITIVHNGQEVKFCCQPCVAKFKADPGRYLSKL